MEAGQYIVSLVQSVDGPVLSEEAAFNLLAGTTVVTNPTQLLNLANNGLFDGSALIDMIENQDFALIILRAQFYPVPVLESIGQHYQPDEEVRMNGFRYLIYRPAPQT